MVSEIIFFLALFFQFKILLSPIFFLHIVSYWFVNWKEMIVAHKYTLYFVVPMEKYGHLVLEDLA